MTGRGAALGGQQRLRRLADAWVILCSAAILAVCAHRAATASLTHDEAFTFLHYPALPVGDLLNHTAAYTNNHLLNSLAMKGSIALFGTGELALRLPNLLALGLYLWYMALLLRRCRPWLVILGFPLLITDTYLMEMFTLARGYGLSYGFLAMALYHARRALEDTGLRHIALFHLAGVLATLSNFALLTAYLAAFGAYLIGLAARARSEGLGWERLRPLAQAHALLGIAAFIALSTPIRRMREANALDFGGKASFYWNTVSTLVDSLVPGISLQAGRMQAAWVVLTLPVAIALALVAWRLMRRDAGAFLRAHGGLAIAALTLVLSGLGAYAQHLLFGVDHLTGRFALFLLVPLLLTFILLLEVPASRGRIYPALVLAAACAWMVPRFLSSFGPYSSWEWNYDTRTKEAMQALARNRGEAIAAGDSVQVGISWLFEPSMNYYRLRMGLDWMRPLDREGLRAEDDYRYVLEGDTSALAGFAPLARFEPSGTVLLRREAAAARVPLRAMP